MSSLKLRRTLEDTDIQEIKQRFQNINTIPMSYRFGIVDTETTGLKTKLTMVYPVQIAAMIVKTPTKQQSSEILDVMNTLVKTDGWDSHPDALVIHGITKERADTEGIPLKDALQIVYGKLKDVDAIVGHNISYDMDDVILPCMKLVGMEDEHDILSRKPRICTCDIGARICIPLLGYKDSVMKNGNVRRTLHLPKLMVLYEYLTGEKFDRPAHDAMNDCLATYVCIQIIVDKYVPLLRTYPGCNELFKYKNFTNESRLSDIFGV
jgi:DNA polymerase III epsilon subunit-like protein